MPVALLQLDQVDYPEQPPFHPSTLYPELIAAGCHDTQPANRVYGAVRQTLALLGLDAHAFGTTSWNPLKSHVAPGDKIVIKPNFVLHEFGAFEDTHCLTTHGSTIRAIVDYAYLAGGPDSTITIADAPLQGADFERILQRSGIYELQAYYWRKHRYEIAVHDLRQVRAVIDHESSFIKETQALAGDPLGYHVIDMGVDSRLSELDSPGTHYVVGDYDSVATNTRHNLERHQYVLSRTVLDADTVISIPKLKTHSKVGLTVCLKNMVGIVGSKDCLPHHRAGQESRGGDEFPDYYPMHWRVSNRVYARLQNRVPVSVWRLLRLSARRFFGAGTPMDGGKQSLQTSFYASGGWHGNNTIWRTVDDLNRLLFFYNPKTKRLHPHRQRRFFTLVDGIVAMEGNGPLRGVPKSCGVLLAGEDPLAVDVVAATLMGFDWRRIRLLQGAVAYAGDLKYSDFTGNEAALAVLSNVQHWPSLERLKISHLGFVPPAGWRHHVEASNVGHEGLPHRTADDAKCHGVVKGVADP